MLTTDSQTILVDAQEAQGDALDFAMSKTIAEALHLKYPGHLWAVRVRGDQGVATIHNLMLSAEYGYLLKLDKNFSISDLEKRAIRGAGEILERFAVMRGKAQDDNLASMATDFTGRVLGDLSK